jgi:hypothetical protein
METTIQQTENVQKLLKFTYGIIPIVAGLDKFTNLLTRWGKLSQPVNCRNFTIQ